MIAEPHSAALLLLQTDLFFLTVKNESLTEV
jgi:hypothetical protein